MPKFLPLLQRIVMMVKRNFPQILIYALTISLLFCACHKKPCESTSCLNAGILTYQDGRCYCDCPSSTKGEHCEISLLDSLAGTYHLADSCAGTYRSISLVRDSVNKNYFWIKNMGEYSCSADYYVSFHADTSYARIDTQIICAVPSVYGGYQMSGNGKIYFTDYHIVLSYISNYVLAGSNRTDNCTVVLSRY
jgi:hypothetical protein